MYKPPIDWDNLSEEELAPARRQLAYAKDLIRLSHCPYTKAKAAGKLFFLTGKREYGEDMERYSREYGKCKCRHKEATCLFPSGLSERARRELRELQESRKPRPDRKVARQRTDLGKDE
jgi:hypothetical protein